jgi:hypothetical protein
MAITHGTKDTFAKYFFQVFFPVRNNPPCSTWTSGTNAMSAPASQPSLHDAVVEFLRGRPEGVPAAEIAGRFLKLKNPDQKAAAAAIAGLLGQDRRCFSDVNGCWHAGAPAVPDDVNLLKLPWIAAYGLTDPGARRLLYCALWELTPSPSCTVSGWLADPHSLPFDEYDMLLSAADEVYSREASDALLDAIVSAGGKRIPIFISASVRGLIEDACAGRRETLTDDTALAGQLLAAAGLAVPRPLTLASLEKTALGAEQPGTSARKQGKRFADALHELLRTLAGNGIESRGQLDICAGRDKAPLFEGKEFTYETLLALPARPGVYGFRDRAGKWLYVGKANNLRRRLLGYFADAFESPQKIERLRSQAHVLVTHACGSELECLVYEYRLIKTHAPSLNRKTEVFERNGAFRPISDCIVLLPHAEKGKGMSLWFRENQKILLKSFSAAFPADVRAAQELLGELKSFFFTPRLPAASADFPEQEISVRWIKRHADSLAIVPVSRLSGAEEIFDSMRIAWRDMQAGPLRTA